MNVRAIRGFASPLMASLGAEALLPHLQRIFANKTSML